MHIRIIMLAVFGMALNFAGQARADIAPPLPPTKNGVVVAIEVDENAKGPKLVIPNGLFTPPRVRPGPRPNAPKGELPQENGDRISENTTSPQNGLLYAGVALALAMSFGGLWFIRRNGKGSTRGLGLLLAAGATIAVGATIWANAPPPPLGPRPPKAPAANPIAFEGKVDVLFTFGNEPVRLVLDKESYEKLKKGELKLKERPADPK